jgi:hypothetical protein
VSKINVRLLAPQGTLTVIQPEKELARVTKRFIRISHEKDELLVQKDAEITLLTEENERKDATIAAQAQTIGELEVELFETRGKLHAALEMNCYLEEQQCWRRCGRSTLER